MQVQYYTDEAVEQNKISGTTDAMDEPIKPINCIDGSGLRGVSARVKSAILSARGFVGGGGTEGGFAPAPPPCNARLVQHLANTVRSEGS